MKNIRDRIKELRRVRAADLKGAPWNWRTHTAEQRQAVAGSIEELGITDALKCRETSDGELQLWDGHLRQEIIDRVGPDTMIPVLITDLTEDEAKKANLIHDPLSQMAEADRGKLDELIAEVAAETEAIKKLIEGMEREPVEIVPLQLKPLPKLAWVLIGIPLVRFAEISSDIERIASIDGVTCETTVSDENR